MPLDSSPHSHGAGWRKAPCMTAVISGVHAIHGTTIVSRLKIVPAAAQIVPNRVHGLDQCDLLPPSPALEFFFPRDRLTDVAVALEPDKTVAVVTLGKAVVLSPFVLENAPEKIAGNSDVEGVTAAGHDVRAVATLVHAAIVCAPASGKAADPALRSPEVTGEKHPQILPPRAASRQDDSSEGLGFL